MPKSSKINEKVFQRVPGTSTVACLVCSTPFQTKTMHVRHVKGHEAVEIHQYNLKHSQKKKRVGLELQPQPGNSDQLARPSDRDRPTDCPQLNSSKECVSPDLTPLDLLSDPLPVPIDDDGAFESFTGAIDMPIEDPSPVDEHAESDLFVEGVGTSDGLGLGFDGDDWSAYLAETINVPRPQTSNAPGRQPNYGDVPFPWPSMAMFRTHLLFSSPRLRFSSAQQQAILEWAADMGANVPTCYAYAKFQQSFQKLMGERTVSYTSNGGTVFYMNDIGKAIADDYANPATRFAMEDYAEDNGNQLTEARQAAKMLLNIPTEVTTPTICVRRKIFYVNEILKCSTGEYFIPNHFYFESRKSAGVEKRKIFFAIGFNAKKTDTGFNVAERPRKIQVSEFTHTFEDILEQEGRVCFSEQSSAYQDKMPHRLRIQAGKRMVYSVPIIIFMDDVSGNISKQWNKHHVVYMSNTNLPRQLIEKERHVRFVSSSPHATPMELVKGVVDSIKKSAANGVVAWDCKHEEEVLLVPYILFWAGDNPMQAEVCSQGGLACNYFCRTCTVGGTKQFKREDEGFLSLFEPGTLRTPKHTLDTCYSQLTLSTSKGGAAKLQKSVAETGTRDPTGTSAINGMLEKGKQMRSAGKSEAEVKTLLLRELEDLRNSGDSLNPLLGMLGVDIHQDTPTEILHTILLGIVKYFWAQTTQRLNKLGHFRKFQTRLASANINGLNGPTLSAEYICKYKGSLIGKHFKLLSQLMPFLVYDLVSSSLIEVWTAIGELDVLLWHQSISDLEIYVAQLRKAINKVLDATAECVPKIITTKPKFHFLTHIPDFIRRFGPILLCSTERYESFNHVFRLTQVYSNQQAQSRDACLAFAEFDAVKHFTQSGYVRGLSTTDWVRADPTFLEYVCSSPRIQDFLGISNDAKPIKGKATLPPYVHAAGKRTGRPPPALWCQTQCSKSCVDNVQVPQDDDQYHIATNIIANNGDKISVAHFAIVLIPHPQVACVREILVPVCSKSKEASLATHVCVELLEFGPPQHTVLSYPSVKLTGNLAVIQPEVIECAVNLQHNCELGGCKEGRKTVYQERQATTRQCTVVVHSETPAFMLNTNALHNHNEIRTLVNFYSGNSGLSQILPSSTVRSTEESRSIRMKAAEKLRNEEKEKKRPRANSGSDSNQESNDGSEAGGQTAPRKQPKAKKRTKPKTGQQASLPLSSTDSISTYCLTPSSSRATSLLPRLSDSPYTYPPHSVPPTVPYTPHSAPATVPYAPHSMPVTAPYTPHSVPVNVPYPLHSVPATVPYPLHAVPLTVPFTYPPYAVPTNTPHSYPSYSVSSAAQTSPPLFLSHSHPLPSSSSAQPHTPSTAWNSTYNSPQNQHNLP